MALQNAPGTASQYRSGIVLDPTKAASDRDYWRTIMQQTAAISGQKYDASTENYWFSKFGQDQYGLSDYWLGRLLPPDVASGQRIIPGAANDYLGSTAPTATSNGSGDGSGAQRTVLGANPRFPNQGPMAGAGGHGASTPAQMVQANGGAPAGAQTTLGGPSTLTPSQTYAQAYAAAAFARKRAQVGGRAGTILGGFGASAPQTRTATLLGA